MPALLAAGPAPAITRFEILPATYGVSGHFRFFPKPERPTVFVKLTAEDGTVGWGQSVPVPTWSYESPESVASTLESYLGPAIVGASPFDIAGLHARMQKAIASSFSTGMPIAKAGIDLAAHDLAGRILKKNVADAMWARKGNDRVVLSYTINPVKLEETDELVAQGKALGYRHFNLKVAPDPKFDIELCKRVRKLAPDAFLWIDANGGYDVATALRVAPRFADLGVDVFEQPIAPNRLSGLRELKQQGALPILLDEGVVSSVDLLEFIKLGILDGVAMKPARTAGLLDARRQIEILQNGGLLFLGSGLTDPDVSLAASLVLYGAYGLKYPAALNGLQFLRGSYLKTPLVLEDGAIRVPTGPGLGVEVDETKLTRRNG